jgi:tetratricopeptide (TPR) repeat protein
MDASERELVFESAMEDYRARHYAFAASALRRLVEDGSAHPAHLSYCGLLVALTEGRYEEAAALCRRAIHKDGRRAGELYLNLARVLAMARRRGEAIVALTEGLAHHPADGRLRVELQHLVPRAKPAFASLPRRHPLNKYAGIARTVGTRLWVTFVPRVRRVPQKPSTRDRKPLPPPG